MIYQVKWLKQTCNACPSQWEGETVCGKPIYIRYRWGALTCTEDVGGPNFIERQVIGDSFHGVLEQDEMIRHLQSVFDFSNTEYS